MRKLFDTSIGWRFVNPRMEQRYGVDAMGETAENVARGVQGLARGPGSVCVRLAEHAAAARARGAASRVEITPVDVPGDKRGETKAFEHDEFLRPDTTIEKLSKLKPAFRSGGSVTAGNSPGSTMEPLRRSIASEHAVHEFGLEPIARVVTTDRGRRRAPHHGHRPGTCVARRCWRGPGCRSTTINVIELNEAFAAQSVASSAEARRGRAMIPG